MGLGPALFMTSEGVPCISNCSYPPTTSAHPSAPWACQSVPELARNRLSGSPHWSAWSCSVAKTRLGNVASLTLICHLFIVFYSPLILEVNGAFKQLQLDFLPGLSLKILSREHFRSSLGQRNEGPWRRGAEDSAPSCQRKLAEDEHEISTFFLERVIWWPNLRKSFLFWVLLHERIMLRQLLCAYYLCQRIFKHFIYTISSTPWAVAPHHNLFPLPWQELYLEHGYPAWDYISQSPLSQMRSCVYNFHQ